MRTPKFYTQDALRESLKEIESAYSFPKFLIIILFLVVLYALSAVYFAGVMVRLMLTLTPVVCILSGVAFSVLLELYLKDENSAVAQASEDSSDKDEDASSSNKYDKVSTFNNQHLEPIGTKFFVR